jgi:hypothetical protein
LTAGFAAFDCAGREAGRATFFCCFAGVDLDAASLFPAAGLEAAALDAGGAALRAGALFTDFFDVLPLDEAVSPTFVALRAGAFSAADERLVIGFGRAADLLPNVRLFPEDAGEF